jgi:hypothetical protein
MALKEFHCDVDLKGLLELAGSAGSSGQMLESRGSGSPPVWGRVITTSTADPSGGNDGDIWIKYTA